jgi:hypothetical protein
MKNRAKSKDPMESNRGAEPATLVPPVSLANKLTGEEDRPSNSRRRFIAFENAQMEVTHGLSERLVLPDNECDESASAEIDAIFQRKLAGIRRLPKHERSSARRAAMEERAMAHLALRRKREATRQLRRFLLRLCGLIP